MAVFEEVRDDVLLETVQLSLLRILKSAVLTVLSVQTLVAVVQVTDRLFLAVPSVHQRDTLHLEVVFSQDVAIKVLFLTSLTSVAHDRFAAFAVVSEAPEGVLIDSSEGLFVEGYGFVLTLT